MHVEPAVRCPIEGVSVYRCEQAPGIELRDVARCSRAWWTFCAELELIVPGTFHGRVWYHRRLYQLRPGQILCARPGELVRVADVQQPGSLKLLMLDPMRLPSHRAAYDVRGADRTWLPTMITASPPLSEALEQAFLALQGQSLDFLEAALVTLLVAISECGCVCESSSGTLPYPGATCKCRGHDLGSQAIDPLMRASRSDLSRDQTDRRFKHRNGLPPYAYSLCVRIAQARQLLRSGSSPSQVAVAQGFTDQSHFTRHFKQHVGLTPRQYARASSAQRCGRSQCSSPV
jgi:AraC-like DNA-binding protein